MLVQSSIRNLKVSSGVKVLFQEECSVVSRAPNVAVVGATGAVGQEFLTVLEQRNFPFASLSLLASSRSAGKTVTFKGKTHTITELKEDKIGRAHV